MEWSRRVSNKSSKSKKFASGTTSGVIGGAISIIYKCNSNGWWRRSRKGKGKVSGR